MQCFSQIVSLFFVIVVLLPDRVYSIDSSDTARQRVSINDGSDLMLPKHIRFGGSSNSNYDRAGIESASHRYLQSVCVRTELQLKAAIDAVPVGTVGVIPTLISICKPRLLLTTGLEFSGEYFSIAQTKSIRFVCTTNSTANCIIDGQSVGFGFLASYGSTISVVGITFQNFRQSVFSFYTDSVATLENTNFLHNSNPQQGGAIFLYVAELTLLGNCRFFNNTAPWAGGAIIFIVGKFVADGNIMFQKNTANNGGALHIATGIAKNGMKLTGVTFDRNTAVSNVSAYMFKK